MGPGVSVLAAGAVTGIAQLVKGETPSVKLLAGVGILGAGVLAVAAKSPEVASKFGTLILLTAFMISGVDIARAVGNVMNR